MAPVARAPVALVALATVVVGRLSSPPVDATAVADARLKAVKAKQEQIMAGVAQNMAKADAVSLVTAKALAKMKENAKDELAPLPLDAKAVAAGRALLKAAAKNSQGVKVEEDDEGTALIAEKLLGAYASTMKDAKMRQLFETTKDTIKAVRTKKWKSDTATAAEVEKDIAKEASKELPVEVSKLKRWAKKKVASFTQTVANPVPVVSGDVDAMCDQFEQGLAVAKKQGLVNHEESLLGLMIIHQRKHDWSVDQRLDATPEAVARVFLQVAKALPLIKHVR